MRELQQPASSVVTSQEIQFTLVPPDICDIFEEVDAAVQLAVNTDALTAELKACTEVGFEADFVSYFITATCPHLHSPSHMIEEEISPVTGRSKSDTEAEIDSLENLCKSWRHFESLPSAELLNSQYQHESHGRDGDTQEEEEEEVVRVFSDRWKRRPWSPRSSVIGDRHPAHHDDLEQQEQKQEAGQQQGGMSSARTEMGVRGGRGGPETTRRRRANICLLFGGEMDGMKSKAHLLIESFSSALFQWSYWSDVAERSSATQTVIYNLAKRENVRVFESVFGFAIHTADMSTTPTVHKELLLLDHMEATIGPYDSLHAYADRKERRTETKTEASAHMAVSVQDLACEYMFLRLRMANFSTDRAVLAPAWVAEAWIAAVDMFSPPRPHPPCSALLFGNDKSALPLMMVGVARLLGIPR